MKSIEEIRDFFKNDRFAVEMGAEIDEVTPQKTVCSLRINNNHKNAVGGVMGGAIFTLADFAFAVAANHETAGVVSLSSTVTFLSAPKCEKLIATANLIKDGRTTCYYIVEITDENDNKIASVTFTGFHTEKR